MPTASPGAMPRLVQRAGERVGFAPELRRRSSVRVSPFSPSQTIAVRSPRALGVSIDAVVGEVRLAPDEPLGERKAPRGVEHLLVRLNHSRPRNSTTASQNHSGSSIERSRSVAKSATPDVRHEAPEVRPGDVAGMPHRARLPSIPGYPWMSSRGVPVRYRARRRTSRRKYMSGVPPLRARRFDVADEHEVVARLDDLVHVHSAWAMLSSSKPGPRPFGGAPPYTGELVDASRGEQGRELTAPGREKIAPRSALPRRKAVRLPGTFVDTKQKERRVGGDRAHRVAREPSRRTVLIEGGDDCHPRRKGAHDGSKEMNVDTQVTWWGRAPRRASWARRSARGTACLRRSRRDLGRGTTFTCGGVALVREALRVRSTRPALRVGIHTGRTWGRGATVGAGWG